MFYGGNGRFSLRPGGICGWCACFNFTGRQYENVNLRKERAEFIIRTQTVFASLTESKKHHTIKFWFRTYII